MRVTFVTPYFYPAWEYGGTPRAAFDLAAALVQRHHAVQILTTDSGGSSRLKPETGKPELAGMDVIYYRNISNNLAYRHRLFFPLRLFAQIRARLSTSDVVHVHEFRSTLSVAAFYAAQSLGIPYFLSPHGGLRHLGKTTLKSGFDTLFGKKILHDAAGLFALSEAEGRDASNFGVEKSRIHVIPNQIDLAPFESLPEPGTFRRRWNLDEGKLVLFLGRLHWIKGADLLIQAFHKLQDAAQVRLVIAGPDDGQESELRQLTSRLQLDKRVIFTGYMDAKQKIEALTDVDVVVLPSRSDGFSLTAPEALLAGKPTLLSSACGLSTTFQRELGVLWFENGNVDDLAAKLNTILKDESYIRGARNAHDVIARDFAPNTIASQVEAVYSSAQSKRAGK